MKSSKFVIAGLLVFLLCGCADFSSRSPPEYCYGPPGSKLVPAPANEQALFDAAKNYKGPADNEFPPNHPKWNRFYRSAWYKTADGQLQLCREPISAIDSCENQTYVFERVNGSWKLKYGIQGFCTG